MASKIRIQDDLYQHVNGEWLEKAEIPADRPTAGGFSELDQGVEKALMEDFASFADGSKPYDEKMLGNAVKFYKKVLDLNRRNEEGIAPILPLLEKIKGLKDAADLNKHAKELLHLGVDLPLNMGVTNDMQDATRHCFVLLGPSIILPDTTYYDHSNPQGPQLIALFSQMAKALLAATPLSEDEQSKTLQEALAFDALVAKRVKSQVEWADYVKNHNPMPLEEVQKYVAPFDLKGLLQEIYGQTIPETIIVYDPRAIKEFKEYFSEENFPLFRSWCYLNSLVSGARYLSEGLHSLATSYHRALTGVASDPVIEKQAYQAASSIYSEPVGVYYGRTYFGEEAKKDIVSLVHKIIDTYKERVAKNAFLQEATKKKAILKLSTIEVKMGYPDFVHDFYDTLTVEEKDSYFEAACKIGAKRIAHEFEKLFKPVDRSEWGMPGHMVNACYNPSLNDITFPAAILQPPFYSIHQSISENLGGIGAVIGHEISHAFDNNGAQFDEKGNLAQWWAKEDYEAFQALTQKMIEEFDGIPYRGGKVNGTLVVSENIADNGGMAVTLEIMHTLDKPDFQSYFKNWAKVWCQKAKDEYVLLLLQMDVHSPAELRANIQPRNFKEWYEAFDVKDSDKMFIPEDKRIIIW